MWAGLVWLPKPLGSGIFALGGVLLSTDYEVLKTLRLDRQYRWITTPGIVTEARQQYKRKTFIERGPGRINLHSQANGDFRGSFSPSSDSVYEGLTFRVYVEAPLDESTANEETANDGVTHYDLRLGTIEVTRVSESDQGQTLFFSVIEWSDTFEDETEARLAGEVQERLRRGDNSDEPFAKVVDVGSVNEYDVDEWRSISEWADEKL